MKIKVNKNFVWASTFVSQLSAMGVKHACISPGSRNTPLAYSLAENVKIKCFVNIDERSSAFFALGLAKATGKPILVVTTSGTATGELLPAIIEAYQQRTPLVICTADRPPELIGTGANQTINQHNLYRNHIRWFKDVGLPKIKEFSLQHLQKIACKAYQTSCNHDKGPVHLNFPFSKPLEPFSFDGEINENLLDLKPFTSSKKDFSGVKIEKDRKVIKLTQKIMQCEKGLIIVGPMEYNAETLKNIKSLASIIQYPIIADAVSHLRFKISKSEKKIISQYNAFLTSNKFCNRYNPDLIIHFGATPTSAILLNYLAKCNAARYQLNEFGDLHDPSRNTKMILNHSAGSFTGVLLKFLSKEKFARQKTKWLSSFVKAENISKKVTSDILKKGKIFSEPRVILKIVELLPSKTNLFIGNSLPIRDLDCFSGTSAQIFNLYFNRGASGIDGVVSTAIGVASIKKMTVLIVGDLSFLHDLNSLLIVKKYSIPIIIIVINNNGGRIFQNLPISKKKKFLKEYFITPQNLNLKDIVEAFGIKYKLIKNRTELRNVIESQQRKVPIILEIQTDASESVKLREKIFRAVKSEIDKQFS